MARRISWFPIGSQLRQYRLSGIRQAIPANDPFAAQADEYQQNFTNYLIEIPAEVTFYQTLNDKNEFFFMIGTGLAYNLSNRTETTLYNNGGANQKDNSPTDEVTFRAINMEFQAALGWEKAFSPTLRLVVQPHFQFWMRGLI